MLCHFTLWYHCGSFPSKIFLAFIFFYRRYCGCHTIWKITSVPFDADSQQLLYLINLDMTKDWNCLQSCVSMTFIFSGQKCSWAIAIHAFFFLQLIRACNNFYPNSHTTQATPYLTQCGSLMQMWGPRNSSVSSVVLYPYWKCEIPTMIPLPPNTLFLLSIPFT